MGPHPERRGCLLREEVLLGSKSKVYAAPTPLGMAEPPKANFMDPHQLPAASLHPTPGQPLTAAPKFAVHAS